MLDPKIMDEQLGINRDEIANRYKTMDEAETGLPFPVQQSGDAYVDRDQMDGYYEDDYQYQEQTPPSMARPGKAYAQDRPYFEGGPMESEVLAWKKQFGKVYLAELEGEAFLFRRINRFEYKEMMAVPGTNELSREEMICEICVLFPRDYSYANMTNEAGGIPTMLAEQVMQRSGFTRKVKVMEL